ncbi:L-ascorbate oxidase [Sesamum angolense]|uniref:L-ascorbate oxidase n=1 Tax=Sesamum angolense TaxID=2727404 RepID=A0AAE2C4S0_9LAMI|nr:L-ascorbate oxidase [Sesamum angolense]
MVFNTKMIFALLFLCFSATCVFAGDPTLEFEWKVTYGTIAPLGVPQQGILINGQFPGPAINCTSNNNIVVNVFNQLDEPLLLTWAGIQQRKNSWQDGTPALCAPSSLERTTPIASRSRTRLEPTFTSLPPLSTGPLVVLVCSRSTADPLSPFPLTIPRGVSCSSWGLVQQGPQVPKEHSRFCRSIGRPDGIQINGQSSKVGDANAKPLFTFEAGKTYRFRVCNVGLRLSVNFRVQGHTMKVVEVEGSHTVQNLYDSLDLHVGQCMSVLVTADQTPKDYYFVASSRFAQHPLSTVAVIRYANGNGAASPELPPPPPENTKGIAWSISQFRSFRWNLTASAARPNPQGSYKYGKINITRTIKLVNTRSSSNGKLRFGINGRASRGRQVEVAPNVVNGTYRNFVEIIFENHEKTIQTWHLDGFSFFAVAIEPGRWSPEKRKNYNLLDALSRNTVQVYPNSWAAVMTTLDNAGMWNLRSEMRERAYLGQQFYLSVVSEARSLRDEYSLPETQELCGIVKSLPKPAPYT